MSGEFTLGQRVKFTRPMKRRNIPTRTVGVDGTVGGAPYRHNLSINKEWQGNEFAPEREGIIVGKRTLSNGYAQWEEYGTEYTAAEHFTAWMIVTDLRSAPVHVLPEHITALDLPADDEPTHEGWDSEHFGATGCDGSLHPEDCLGNTHQGAAQ